MEEEIRMAKEMGLNPKSLIKNIPNKSEQWKAPVKEWIHDMYDKRQEKSRKKAKLHTHEPKKASIKAANIYTVDRSPKGATIATTENKNFTLFLPKNQVVQLDLTGLLKSIDRLIDMVGSVFRTKVIRYFHQVIQGGNIDEERYYLQSKSIQ